MPDYNGYDDTEDEDDDKKLPAASTGQDQTWTLPPSAALVNPVIRNFDTPATASNNTVPVAPPAATNRPTAQPTDDSSPAPIQPAPLVQQPSASTDTSTAAPAAATAPAAPDDPFEINAALYRQFNQSQPAQRAQPAPAAADGIDSNDSASAGSDTASAAPSAPVDPFTANAALYRQFHQNQANELKYHASQGGQTEVLPNGATVIKRDDDGNPLYKPAVVQPFVRGDDGEAYRVSRDEYNNQHYFRIADGAEGQDYHVDPISGDQYVDVSGADGTGKREVIGQDPLVPRINGLVNDLKQHATTTQAANLDIDRATNGVQGGGPMAAASLSDLRDNATQLAKDIKPLKAQLDDMSGYVDNNSDPSDITTQKQLQQQLAFKQDRLNTVQGELDSRDSIIADAKQRRDSTAQAKLDGTTTLDVLRRVKSMGGINAVQGDLSTIAQGGALQDPNPTAGPDQSRWQALKSMGLVNQEPNADGTPGTTLRVTPLGVSMLDDDTQKNIAQDPTKYSVTSNDAPVQPHVARAVGKVANLADTTPPDDPTKPPPGLGDSSQAGARTPKPTPLSVMGGKQLNPQQAQRRWEFAQSSILASYPLIGVAGSPANVAFVRAFRANGGDPQRALQEARGAAGGK